MLPDSQPWKILSAWRSAAFDLVLSEPMLLEITRVLAYPVIRKRIDWSDEEIEHFVSLLRFHAEIVTIDGVDAVIPRDADDAPVGSLDCFSR